ncbi:MAG: DUF262 domain-containing protein [Gemmatimonadetes bacterium]|nr:DUF262 domain-containing protein [Gemmatimonadota bacterium]MYB62291.1 DUF262 domain-containing protein [Gemmatimonadota bacterium]
MAISPEQSTFGGLFENNRTFKVPKYQRGYAWEERSIEDFLNDIDVCLEFRNSGTPKTHFFGGIVVLQNDINTPLQQNFEVIDGQQRLASVVMVVSSVIKCLEQIVEELNSRVEPDIAVGNLKANLETDIVELKRKYLYRTIDSGNGYSEIHKLTLSDADDTFFKGTLVGESADPPNRISHKRIRKAYQQCNRFLTERLHNLCVERKTEFLRQLVNNVLLEDCEVVLMLSDNKGEAYQIFQVLNNRGVQLSDGDLLRASTLKQLYQNSTQIQNQVSELWDRILSYSTNEIDRYLRWCFTSYEGERPWKHEFARQFIDRRFSTTDNAIPSSEEASNLMSEVRQLHGDVKQIHDLEKGVWPFPTPSTVNEWDRKRLLVLARMLRHTNAVPLLLSICEVGEEDLAKAVAVIERTVFRYKTMGNVHIDRLTKLYNRFAKNTRDSGQFSITRLRRELKELLSAVNIGDEVFKPIIEAKTYVVRGSNREIRYMLTTLEEYHQWYENGARGTPKCNDSIMLFDYENTTIEHIYPQNASENERNPDLESVKHMVGNLTILGPEENNRFSNKSTDEKLELFRDSNLMMNRKIAENGTWTSEIVRRRTTRIASMAAKVFVP